MINDLGRLFYCDTSYLGRLRRLVLTICIILTALKFSYPNDERIESLFEEYRVLVEILVVDEVKVFFLISKTKW